MKIKAFFLTVLLGLFMAVGLSQAQNAFWPDAKTFQPYEEAYTLEADVILERHVPFSDERLTMLNDLLKHVSLQTKAGGNASEINICIDGKKAVGVIQITNGDQTDLWFSADPETLYHSEGTMAALIGADEIGYGDLLLGLEPDSLTLIEELRQVLVDLPAAYAENIKTEPLKSKLGVYGTAVRKGVLTVKDEDLANLSEKLGPVFLRLKAMEPSLKGKQVFSYFYNEDGNIIKIQYSGSMILNGVRRNASINWRISDSKEELLLKTPSVSGNDRDNLTFSREILGEGETKQEIMSFSLDHVEHGKRNILSGNSDFTAVQGDGQTLYKGSLDLQQKSDEKGKAYVTLKPEITVYEGKVDGSIGYALGTVKDDPAEAGTIRFALESECDMIEIPDHVTREAQGDLTTVMEPMTRELLTALLGLPVEDLYYFRKDLTEEQWDQVMDALH